MNLICKNCEKCFPNNVLISFEKLYSKLISNKKVFDTFAFSKISLTRPLMLWWFSLGWIQISHVTPFWALDMMFGLVACREHTKIGTNWVWAYYTPWVGHSRVSMISNNRSQKQLPGSYCYRILLVYSEPKVLVSSGLISNWSFLERHTADGVLQWARLTPEVRRCSLQPCCVECFLQILGSLWKDELSNYRVQKHKWTKLGLKFLIGASTKWVNANCEKKDNPFFARKRTISHM